ncbi:MAG: response regulator, partial [Bacteroidetes bacterium]|nr:response regulator [Bacteroidota bacterium]
MKLKKKLNCILLIDDDSDDNEYHEIILRKLAITEKIDIAINGVEAIKYLKTKDRVPPELIFLDINMPKMNGWEFLEEYKDLDVKQKAKVVIMILSTSTNPEYIKKANEIKEVTGYESKPLDKDM